MRRDPVGVATGDHAAAHTHRQLPQTMAPAVTDWHVVQPPHGSASKQPQSRAPVHPLGMGMHAGGRLQHPAQRPVMQISPAPHVLVPHAFPPPPAPAEPAPPPAPPSPRPPDPTAPPLCAPPPPRPPELEPPLAVIPPVADPAVPAAEPPPLPLAPEEPPVADASPALPSLPSFDAHAEINARATTAADRREKVVPMSASAKNEDIEVYQSFERSDGAPARLARRPRRRESKDLRPSDPALAGGIRSLAAAARDTRCDSRNSPRGALSTMTIAVVGSRCLRWGSPTWLRR